MSKNETLWRRIQQDGRPSLTLTLAELEKLAGIPIDHSILNYKKELTEFGYAVGKISLKEQTVVFHKLGT